MTLFFSLAALAGGLYALSNVLLARYVRSIGALDIAVYRNLSFVITMLPIPLLIAPLLHHQPAGEIWNISLQAWSWVITSSLCGSIAFPCMLMSQRCLPIGISSALSQISPVFVIVWAIILGGQWINITQLLTIILLLASIGWLTRTRAKATDITVDMRRGMILLVIWGVFGGLGFFALGQASNLANPFVVGYLWEITIGIFMLLWLTIRHITNDQKIVCLSITTIAKIILCSAPVAIASSLLPFALSLGYPYGIATAVNSATGVILTSVLGWLWYHEHFSRQQLFAITFIILSMVALRVLS